MQIEEPYERQAWREYERWLEEGREAGVLTKSARAAGRVARRAGAATRDVLDDSPVGPAINKVQARTRDAAESARFDAAMQNVLKALAGTYSAAVDASLRTVRPKRAIRHYASDVPDARLENLRQLPLRTLDERRPPVHGAYRLQLASTGTATGAVVGLSITGPQFAAAMAGDVVATIGLSVRGIASHLAHYGYDVTHHTEHAYVMTLLQTAMAETAMERGVLTQQARQLAVGLAKGRTWAELNRNALTQLGRSGFKVVTERMTKRKLALVLPGLSAVVGLGQGYNHGRQVMDVAYFEGRARLLRERWEPPSEEDGGIEIIDVEPER